MKNKEEPRRQTGAYLPYVTIWMRGSDKVVRQIARFYFVNAKYMAFIAFS